jgi:hypothetical protein
MFLWGGSGRYDYPALGSSVPEEQQWRDLELFAAGGGNIWRPGHSSTSEEFVDAADAYGVMIVQPSGDGENGFNTPSADDVTLKKELHRDMIVRDAATRHPRVGVGQRRTNHAVGRRSSRSSNWDRSIASRGGPHTGSLRLSSAARSRAARSAANSFQQPGWVLGNGHARGLAHTPPRSPSRPVSQRLAQVAQANAFGMAQWYFRGHAWRDRPLRGTSSSAAPRSSAREQRPLDRRVGCRREPVPEAVYAPRPHGRRSR